MHILLTKNSLYFAKTWQCICETLGGQRPVVHIRDTDMQAIIIAGLFIFTRPRGYVNQL